MVKTTKSVKKKRRKRLLFLLLILAVLIPLAADYVFTYVILQPIPIAEYSVQLTVGNYTGFNVASDAIYFGTLTPGTSAKRFLAVTNDGDAPIEISVVVDGDVSRFIVLPMPITLGSRLNATVEITASVPMDAAQGDYDGTLRVIPKLVG